MINGKKDGVRMRISGNTYATVMCKTKCFDFNTTECKLWRYAVANMYASSSGTVYYCRHNDHNATHELA